MENTTQQTQAEQQQMQAPQMQQPYQQPMLKTNGSAVAGFILSLVGLLLFGFILGILAVIFSATGLNKIKQQPNVFKGKGLATAGLIIGIVDVIGWLIYIMISFEALF